MEIYLENNLLDVTADISALLTFALDDVKDFSSRQTTFSKTIVLPGTASNNKLFGNIFDTGSANDYDAALSNVGYNFNAAKSAAVIIFQDNLQTFMGKLRLLSIVRDSKRIEYEVALFGNLTALNVALAPSSTNNPDGTTVNNKGYLENLDFSAYNHTYSIANITGSWDNAGGNSYYYPLVDYGNYSTSALTAHSFVPKHDWMIGTFRPALYVKEYIDKMFAAAGFTYQMDMPPADAGRFNKLIVPYNRKVLSINTSALLEATNATSQTVIDYGSTNTNRFHWDSVTGSGFSHGGGDVFTYTGTDPVTVTMDFTVNFSWKTTNNTIALEIRKTSGATTTVVHSKTLGNTGGMLVTSGFWKDAFSVSFNNGDYIEIWATVSDSSTGHVYTLRFTSGNMSLKTAADIPVDVLVGDTVKMNDTIPRNIKQVDFLVSIVKLFNLYVWEDANDPAKIYIKPFVYFYAPDSSNAVDWTYKLNRDKTVTIKPMSELNANVYNFEMADDSDYYNDQYKKRYNQNYGDYTFNSQFEFSTDSQDCKLIFAGTPLVGYGGEEKVYSTIFKRTGSDTSPTEEQTDCVIRILQTKKLTGLTHRWNIVSADGATALQSGLTSYGYAGHFDDPDAPTNDLNFGVLQQLYYTLATGFLSNTQFNLYWSSYMAEITGKDAKLVSGSFYLRPMDVYHLNFSKYIQLDGVLFRLNKITDYNASTPGDCVCELIKVLNTTYTF